MNYNEFMKKLTDYTGTIKTMEQQHEGISHEIDVLQDQKMAHLLDANFEKAERLDVKIEALTRRQGSINSTLLMTPQRSAREFAAMAEDVRGVMRGELAEAQIDYDTQVDEVLRAKEAYVVELLKLTEIRGKAGELNDKFTTMQVEIMHLDPVGSAQAKVQHRGIGSMQERKVFSDGWTKLPEEQLIGISESYQNQIYPKLW